ncbi:glutathione peroxidase [Porticoccus sp. W117]|uniref:glutathione peroxidase n=1 Tax=Porticoccus sp. W117 TaxID=3054777 RepID=UPI002592B0AA|nr:glutathione peroxidase [Porticoccus sp. W117]MDM3869752.1 glutathione peroxidase [Porticoccus sp. W117]
MLNRLLIMLLLSVSAVAAFAEPKLLDIDVRTLAGDKTVNLAETYNGNVVLVVNVASKCGYTYQYEQLEATYQKYRDQGLVILGFPSNDFKGQEPGSEEEIAQFCRLTYGVQFPMFEKMSVKEGGDVHPLYQRLADQKGYPKWNFFKYLIGRDGKLIEMYNSKVEPNSEELVVAIKKALAS